MQKLQPQRESRHAEDQHDTLSSQALNGMERRIVLQRPCKTEALKSKKSKSICIDHFLKVGTM